MKAIITTTIALIISFNSFSQNRVGEISTFKGTLVEVNKTHICLMVNGEAEYIYLKFDKYDHNIPHCKMNNVKLTKGVKLNIRVKAVKVYLHPIYSDPIEIIVWKPIEITRAAQH
jgi:hypothetical protein